MANRFLIVSILALNCLCPAATSAEESNRPILIDEAPAELKDVFPRLWAVAFAPDGKSLATTGGWDKVEPGELVVWDIASEQPKVIRRQERPLPCVAYSSDGRQLATGDFAGAARIVETATGKLLASLPPHKAIINGVVFLPGGQTLVAGSFDGTLTFWDMVAQSERTGLAVPGEQVVSVAAAADGKHLAATTWEGNVHVWNLANRKLLHTQRAIAREGGQFGIAQAVAFAPDGKSFVTGSWDNSVRLWNTASGEEIRAFEGHQSPVQDVAISPTDALLASSDGLGIVMLWNLESGELVARIRAHASRCFGLAFSPDGERLATASWDGTAKLWDVKTQKLVATFQRK